MRLEGGVAKSAPGTVRMGLDRDLDVLCGLYNGIKLGKFSLCFSSDSFHTEGRRGPEGIPPLPALQMASSPRLHP